jgi:uncharacterized membrane protein
LRQQSKDEERIEQIMGNLLRAGVILAAAVVLYGGVLHLSRHGTEAADYTVFRGQPSEYRSPALIAQGALTLGGRPTIQLGLLLLIATPVARVAFSALAFAWQRDYTYVGLTLLVLAVLVYSLVER